MEKGKKFQRGSGVKVDGLGEGLSVCSLGSKGSSQVRKVQKLIEETEEIRRKRVVEEFRRNRIKLALVMHQQMYSELELAAVCIQKHARRYLAVKVVKGMRVEKYKYEVLLRKVEEEIGDFWVVDSSVRHMAAYRIQRYWKGFRKTGLRFDLIQRLVKRVLAQAQFEKERVLRCNKEEGVRRLAECCGNWVLGRVSEVFVAFKVYEVEKSLDSERESESESEVRDQSEHSSESKENAERFEEACGKTGKNEVVSYVIPEKIQLKVIPELIKPKSFVLSEANFHKPTVVSKVKRFDSPLEAPIIIKEKKIRKMKSTKRRLSKQATLKPNSFQEKPKREKSATTRKTPETLVRPPPLPRHYNVQSKIRESLVKQSLRSSSFSIERKESYPKPLDPPVDKRAKGSNENRIDEPREKPSKDLPEEQEKEKEQPIDRPIEKPTEYTLPTLGFKQALPELYQFLESYKPAHRKNPVVQSTTGLIVNKLKNS